MTYNSYEIFNNRYLDIDTGKFNYDKVRSINVDSNYEGHCWPSSYYTSYVASAEREDEFRQKQLQFQEQQRIETQEKAAAKKEKDREDRIKLKESLAAKAEQRKKIRELEQKMLAKERDIKKLDAYLELIYIGGPQHGQRIITSSWNKR